MYEADFSSRLLAGERILWTGRPAGGLLLTERDIFLIPFSIFWCGFMAFWMAGALRGGAVFAVFGLLFAAMGLFFAVGRFIADAWIRNGLRYAVTNCRILVLRKWPLFGLTAVDLERLPQINLNERADGRGTIRFGATAPTFGPGFSGFSLWMPSTDPTPQFLAIDSARQVFDQVQRQRGR